MGSCKMCHLRDPAVRCSSEHLQLTSLWEGKGAGFLDSMLAQATPRGSVLAHNPILIQFEKFVREEEIEALLAAATQWSKSGIGDGNSEDNDTSLSTLFSHAFPSSGARIVGKFRSNSVAWCNHMCMLQPAVNALVTRIEQLISTPRSHMESIQLLRYEAGERYGVHHDGDGDGWEASIGPRVLTIFFYLSDV